MKRFTLTLCVLLAFACTHQRPLSGSALVTVIDITDTNDSHLTARMIMDGLHYDGWEELSVTLISLDEYRFSRQITLVLQKDSSILDNKRKRMKSAQQFEARIDSALQIIYARESNRPRSAIYSTIITAAELLASIPAKHKLLYIASDLQEHSLLFDTYSTYGSNILLHHPEQVRDSFLHTVKPPLLSHVPIILNHRPKTLLANDRFAAMVSIYSDIFSSVGASVSVDQSFTK